MKNIIFVILLAISLAACATTETSITTPENGRIFSMKTTTVFKDVKDVMGNASNEGFRFELGSSTGGLTPDQLNAFLCLVNPRACGQ